MICLPGLYCGGLPGLASSSSGRTGTPMNTRRYMIPCVALAVPVSGLRGAGCRGGHPRNPGSSRSSGREERVRRRGDVCGWSFLAAGARGALCQAV